MRGRMAISFLVAALSSVSPNAKKPTLLPSQSTPVQSPFDSRYMTRYPYDTTGQFSYYHDPSLRSKIAELNALIRKAGGYRWCATSFIVEKIASK